MNLIELQPDDVLVLRCPHVLSREQQASLRGALQLVLGPDQRVVVLDGGQEIDVIRVSLSGKVETNDIARNAPQTDQDDAQRAIWRQEYNALPPADREQYGSFSGYVAYHGGVDPYAREVQHVDTPDEEPAGIPPHVWLYRNMLTDLQALAPLGRDETNGQYAVAIDQLTDEQRAIPHVVKQLPPTSTLDMMDF